MFSFQRFRQKTFFLIIHVMETLRNKMHRLIYESLTFFISLCFVWSGGGNTPSEFASVSLWTCFFFPSPELYGDLWQIVLQHTEQQHVVSSFNNAVNDSFTWVSICIDWTWWRQRDSCESPLCWTIPSMVNKPLIMVLVRRLMDALMLMCCWLALTLNRATRESFDTDGVEKKKEVTDSSWTLVSIVTIMSLNCIISSRIFLWLYGTRSYIYDVKRAWWWTVSQGFSCYRTTGETPSRYNYIKHM